MEGLRKIIHSLPLNPFYVIYVWHEGKLLTWYNICAENRMHMSCIMYWLTTKRLETEHEWLSALRRLTTNADAFTPTKRDVAGTEGALDVVTTLKDYMAEEFSDCPWMLVRETPSHVDKYHVEGNYMASEESHFIVFMWILLAHLDKGKGGAYFLSQDFASELYFEAIELEMRQAVVRWMRGDDRIVFGDQMDVSDGESEGMGIALAEAGDEDSKGKGEA